MKTYHIKGRVWRWPGEMGWHFLSVDKKLTEELKKTGKKYIYGSGFIEKKKKIGKTEWETALFPYSKEGIYLLSIKGAVRKKEEILEGDTILASFTFRK